MNACKPWLLLAALPLFGACEDKVGNDAEPAASAQPAAPEDEAPSSKPERVDLIDQLARCEIRHRGLSLDLGTDAAAVARGFRLPPFDDIENAERDGKTVARLKDNIVSFDMWLDQTVKDPFIELQLHATQARRMSVALDDRRLGVLKLTPAASAVYRASGYKGELAAGRHVVTLRFSGRPRGVVEPHAELFWLRLGVDDDSSVTYAAPTLRSILSDVAIDNVPKRAIALRAPAAIRCPVVLSKDTKLRVDLGFWGTGTGKASVRILSDDAEPVTLAERKVSGGGGATWIPVSLPLGKHAGNVAILELRALETQRTGRVVFGDPMLLRANEARSVTAAKATTAIVVVLSGIDRRRVPPWGPKQDYAGLASLARSSVAFGRYRVPTTVPGAVVASMLTGLPPHGHALEDPAARLPAAAHLISEIIKEASGRTAMFTGSPNSFRAFGFDSGWDDFGEVSPVADEPVSRPIDRATSWLENELESKREARRFVFVHARGAHPPWDVPKDDASRLPPEEYGGVIDPRRGGIILSRLRSRRNRAARRMDEVDWIRLRALEQASLLKQDAALEKLIDLLKRKGEWEHTMLIVTGDVAPGEGPEPPFDPAGRLIEEHLYVPLWVHFPNDREAGKESMADVTSVDIATTVMNAFQLAPPVGVEGVDLQAAAEGIEPMMGRVLLSTLADHYAARFGQYRLTGQIGRKPQLCKVAVDPACLDDVFGTQPIAAQSAWSWTFFEWLRADKLRAAQREPASIDPDTGAALTVWGDI